MIGLPLRVDPRQSGFRRREGGRGRIVVGVAGDEGFGLFGRAKKFRRLRDGRACKVRLRGKTFKRSRFGFCGCGRRYSREGPFGNGSSLRRGGTFAESATQSRARYAACGSTAEGSFQVFAARAVLRGKDRQARLRAFKARLGNFDRGFEASADSGTRGEAATKAGACSLGGLCGGTAEEATGAQG